MADRLSVFPAFHKVENRIVLVVGEGSEAAAKVRLLAQTCASIRLVAASPSDELAALVIAHDLEHRPRGFRPADLDDAVLAFAASGERGEDEAVVTAARQRNVPANAVDVPDLCDFYTPAIVNRAPIAIAITSTGAGPILAQKIRGRIEAMLPVRLGALASLAATFRPAADQILPKGQPRRRFWSSFFEGPVADACYSGRNGDARRLASRLLTEEDGERRGFVSLVGAGPGAEDLLTLRAQRVLQEADVIVHDALVPEAVISMGRRDTHRIAVGKRKGRHSVSQDEINAILVREASAGRRVARLKCGDPLVFGRAGEEMAALRAAGIAFEVVPGVTSALAAAAEAEIPLTLRGVASSLVFATGQDADGDTLPDWAGLALSGTTVAVYMGRSVAARVAERLAEAGLPLSTPVAVIERATQPDRRLLAGTLAGLAALASRTDLDGPALILIGESIAAGALADAEPLFAEALFSRQSLAAA
ncbi:uroporphyrinogen-III C-methyltransferase [Faunimonas pinastri]|uniref:Uroporphyrinogen-III C-methyltransferase n=1 Tax=Faunimonas pinastri TaxID=1855383 RepID=A0A1H9LXC5_9HYPH|nr:siroheme synthase CysG [Faunimonas pinastri]SER15845.1 uroporphyrinogen-III C-methyltransferase [Faunimonas pinastri]